MSPAGGGAGGGGDFFAASTTPLCMNTSFHLEPYGWFTIHCVVSYCLNKLMDIQVIILPEFLLMPFHPLNPPPAGDITCNISTSFVPLQATSRHGQTKLVHATTRIAYLNTYGTQGGVKNTLQTCPRENGEKKFLQRNTIKNPVQLWDML